MPKPRLSGCQWAKEMATERCSCISRRLLLGSFMKCCLTRCPKKKSCRLGAEAVADAVEAVANDPRLLRFKQRVRANSSDIGLHGSQMSASTHTHTHSRDLNLLTCCQLYREPLMQQQQLLLLLLLLRCSLPAYAARGAPPQTCGSALFSLPVSGLPATSWLLLTCFDFLMARMTATTAATATAATTFMPFINS